MTWEITIAETLYFLANALPLIPLAERLPACNLAIPRRRILPLKPRNVAPLADLNQIHKTAGVSRSPRIWATIA
jgi:hypothetical protein